MHHKCVDSQEQKSGLTRTACTAASERMPMLLDLSMPPIVQYLDPQERLSLAVCCKHACHQVELYCKLVLQNIAGPNSCNDDASFQDRIRQGYYGVLDRDRLPFRLLVEQAKKTSLTRFEHPQCFWIDSIKLSPSETRVATTSSGTMNVFDLAFASRVSMYKKRRSNLACMVIIGSG